MVIRIMELSKLLMEHPDIEDVYLSWQKDGTEEEPNNYWALVVTATDPDGYELKQIIDLCLLGLGKGGSDSTIQWVVDELKTMREAA